MGGARCLAGGRRDHDLRLKGPRTEQSATVNQALTVAVRGFAAPSWRYRHLQHAVALVGEQFIGLNDGVELEAVGHKRREIDPA